MFVRPAALQQEWRNALEHAITPAGTLPEDGLLHRSRRRDSNQGPEDQKSSALSPALRRHEEASGGGTRNRFLPEALKMNRATIVWGLYKPDPGPVPEWLAH